MLATNVTIAVQTLVKAQLNFLEEFSSTSLEAMWTSPISIKMWSIFLPATAWLSTYLVMDQLLSEIGFLDTRNEPKITVKIIGSLEHGFF